MCVSVNTCKGSFKIALNDIQVGHTCAHSFLHVGIDGREGYVVVVVVVGVDVGFPTSRIRTTIQKQ